MQVGRSAQRDRQFLLVPYHPDLNLIERLLLGNQLRPHPYPLDWLDIDPRTMDKYARVKPPHDLAPAKWAFYLPSKACPLSYRELSLWFVLWSVQYQHRSSSFRQSYSGLEILAGLGQRTASELMDVLEKHELVKVFPTARAPWFFLYPVARFADWFRPLENDSKPAELVALEKQFAAQCQQKSAKDVFQMGKTRPTPSAQDDECPPHFFQPVKVPGFGWQDLREYNFWGDGVRAAYQKENALAPEEKRATIDTSSKTTEDNHARDYQVPEPESDDEPLTDEAWLQRLKSM